MRWNLALCPGSMAQYQGGACRAPTGPGGWVLGTAGALTVRRGRPQIPTHSSPHWGLPGPASLVSETLRVSDLPRYWTPVLPTRYTLPVYPPGYPPSTHPARHAHRPAMPVHPRACTYGHFWTLVGEPRGSRTHPGFRSQDTKYTVIYRFTGLHGRLTGFIPHY